MLVVVLGDRRRSSRTRRFAQARRAVDVDRRGRVARRRAGDAARVLAGARHPGPPARRQGRGPERARRRGARDRRQRRRAAHRQGLRAVRRRRASASRASPSRSTTAARSQGELARSITALAQVESARVHVAFGKRSLFKDQEEPRVGLGRAPPARGPDADRRAGARRAPAGRRERRGPQARGRRDRRQPRQPARRAPMPTSVDRKAEIERTVTHARAHDARARRRPGKVSVVTTADVDERKVSETEEIYDKDHTGAAQRVAHGSKARCDATPAASAASPARAATCPAHRAVGDRRRAAAAAGGTLQETKNYEVSRTRAADHEARRRSSSGCTSRCVVDYKTGADGKPVARTDKELAELTALARRPPASTTRAATRSSSHVDPVRARCRRDRRRVRAACRATRRLADHVRSRPAAPARLRARSSSSRCCCCRASKKRRARRPRRRSRCRRRSPSSSACSRPARSLDDGRERPRPAGRPPVHDRVLDVVRGDVERAAGVLTAWLAEPPPKASAKGAKPMTHQETMTGPRRAAIALLSLDEEVATQVLAQDGRARRPPAGRCRRGARRRRRRRDHRACSKTSSAGSPIPLAMVRRPAAPSTCASSPTRVRHRPGAEAVRRSPPPTPEPLAAAAHRARQRARPAARRGAPADRRGRADPAAGRASRRRCSR